MTIKNIFICCLVLAAAIFVYSLFGREGELFGDDALMMYSGQKMADGVPPYVSTFYNLAPLGPMLMGLGVIAARTLGTDDFLTVRLIFFGIGCLTAVSIYLLCRQLLGSVRGGLFGAFSFLGFYGFAERAASGPRDKTAMALFQTLGLYFICRRNWFWAGVFTAMAFLTWQPMGIYPAAALVLALAQPGPARWPAAGRCLLGIALPVSLVLGYFAYYGALDDLIDGAVLFVAHYFPLSHETFFEQIITIFHGSGGIFPVFGLCMIIYLYLWRYRQNSSLFKTLFRDDYAPLLITFGFPVFWSVFLDFRGYDDFFVFLPYVSVGFALLPDLALRQIANTGQVKTAKIIALALGAALVITAGLTVRFNRNLRLIEQKQAVAEIERRFGKDCTMLAIDEPQPLVFLHKTNPTRYVYAFFHFDRWIHDHTAGGFDGWLAQLDDFGPDIVVYGNNPCTYAEKIRNWLNKNFTPEQIGPWQVYIKKPKR